MNQALVLGSLRQNKLTAAAASANTVLRVEINERKLAEQRLHRVQAQLADRAGQLESLVVKRTRALTAVNKRLEVSVEAIGRGKEAYRLLFLESQITQRKLSQLTRQIIGVQEEERKEISRELHDEVVQTLVGINVELSALAKGNSIGLHLLKQKIVHAQRMVEHSVSAVHRFARGLRPAVLDDLGLIPALHAYSKSLAAGKKLIIQITAFGGVEELNSIGRTVLFRVAQEALTNVVRHAHATRVKLDISEAGGAIQMEITDDGQSFPVGKVFHGKIHQRLGLIGMRERIEMIGGRLILESRPGEGTTVRAVVPFNRVKTRK